MSQTPHPHDPYGSEPGSAVPEQPVSPGPEPSAPDQELGSPTSDPALHPHDPYAYSATSQPPSASSSADGIPPRGPAPDSRGGEDAYRAPSSANSQDPFGAPATGTGQGGYPAGQPGMHNQHGAQGQYGQHNQYGNSGPSGPMNLEVPPPGLNGVYDGPLSGQPMQDSEAKTWALVVHLAALLQFVIPFIGGLIAQIVLYVIFKDRNRFVRYNAAEALNGTIAALIIAFALGVVFTIITIVTFGIGAFLYTFMFIPTVVQAIFAIIGAVKAYQGVWWNYPMNLRLLK